MPPSLSRLPGLWLLALFLFLGQVVPALAGDLAKAVAAVPNPRVQSLTWVADPAGTIRTRLVDINALADAFEKETGTEIAVVVLPSIGEFNPKEFATALFQHWGIGKQGRDNGLLVLHVLDQRRIEIETGYGLEGALPDIKCHWIIEDIAIPFFRAGSFADGHYEVVRALIAGIRNPDADRRQLASQAEATPGQQVDPAPADYRLAHAEGPATAPVTAAEASAGPGLLAPSLGLAGLALLPLFGFRVRRFQQTRPDPHEQWTYLRRQSWLVHGGMALALLGGVTWEFQDLDSLWSILGVLPGGFLTSRYVRRRLQSLRDQPRLDPDTGETMQRLDEQADDAYLEAGQVSEERIRSVDYDVWVSASGRIRIDRYDGDSPADQCPACGYLTSRLTGSLTVLAATRYSTGLAEDTYSCAHCRHSNVVKRTLEKLVDSSGSGGGFSGGGSFGGGSSGGGGAGGSY